MHSKVQKLLSKKASLSAELKQRTDELHQINNEINEFQANCPHKELTVVDEYVDYLYADPRYHIAIQRDCCGVVTTRQEKTQLVYGKKISSLKRLEKK